MENSQVGATSTFYYHTLHTIHLVLETGAIRARNCAYLNDSEEFIFGLRVLEKFFGKADTAELVRALLANAAFGESPIYPISLTTNNPANETSLVHWVMYSSNGGAALELDWSDAQGAFWFKAHDDDFQSIGQGTRKVDYHYVEMAPSIRAPEPITYLPEGVLGARTIPPKQKKELNSLQTKVPRPQDMAAHIKRAAFEQERESRLLWDPSACLNSGNVGPVDLVSFMEVNGKISPYIDAYYDDAPRGNHKNDHKSTSGTNPHWWRTSLTKNHGWPVVSVFVGPGREQDQVWMSLHSALSHRTVHIRPLSATQRCNAVRKCFERWIEIVKLARQASKDPVVTEEVLTEIERTKDLVQNAIASLTAPNEIAANVEIAMSNIRSLAASGTVHAPLYAQCLNNACIIDPSGILLQRASIPFVF